MNQTATANRKPRPHDNISLLPATTNLAALTVDSLEQQIGLLSAHINAANFRLLELIGELDRREPWGGMGCKSCAHYLNWKCGIALGAAREKTRTARALRKLPQIRAAFAAGRVSYSKVRALTRVATTENEDMLLEVAMAGTASHTERMVRHYRQARAASFPEETFNARKMSAYFDDDGMLVINARLTADQGAMFLQAIDTLRVAHDTSQLDDTFDTGRADALAQMAELAIQAKAANTHTADRFQVRVGVPAKTLLGESGAKPGTESDVEPDAATPDIDALPAIDSGPVISLQTLRRLACDCSVIPVLEDQSGQPLSVGRKTRTVPSAMRRALERRDGGCCFPGCTQTRHLDAHHIEHWAQGGKTELSNLVLLCRKHHTWLHEGGYQLKATANGLVFTTPRGHTINRNDDQRFRGDVNAIVRANENNGNAITPTTADCSWDGRSPDWPHIMQVVCQHLPDPPPRKKS